MRAVEFKTFGPAQEVLKIRNDVPMPEPGAGEILVRVAATSVNPIDCAVRSGYGAAFFLAKGLVRLPLIPGRDIAGTVEKIGEGVSTFKPGQAIYAASTNFATAEFISIPAAWAAQIPKSLSFAEAAALPYAALTSWSALVDTVKLTEGTTVNKRIVIPRGAGGVGSTAIQLMKAWGAHVASVCSTRNVKIVRKLGADIVVDYLKEDFSTQLHDYDVAFDTAFDTEQKLLNTLKSGADAAYVSIVTPKMNLIDQYGLDEGLTRGEAFLAQRKTEQSKFGRRYDWAFMEPNGTALAKISKLVDAGKIRPLIDRVYRMEEIVEAHHYCETKKAQGKIVVTVAD